MRKSIVVMLCIISLLIGILCGMFIPIDFNTDSKNDMVGTYKTSTWNGKDAVLVLNEDGTCIHPAGYRGTWSFDDNTLVLDIPSFSDSFGTSKIRPTIVPNGIMLSGHFFEKT